VIEAWRGHRVDGFAVGFLGLLLALFLLAAPTKALADPTFSVMNAPEGVYWRSEPNWSAAERVSGFGVYNGTIIEVHCYQSGTAVEGSSDTMWEYATDVGGSGYGSGWVDEHFINDNQPLDQPSPGVGPCGGAAAVSAPPAAPASTASPPPAPAGPKPTCYGDYCSGKNPAKTNCAPGAKVIASVPKTADDDTALELLWSATCQTKWARMIVPAGWWSLATLAAEQNTGYTQETGVGGHYGTRTEVVTPMIYSPKKCVKAIYVPGIGYSWNAIETACR
jgi:Protein of unknown function (DUF2690)